MKQEITALEAREAVERFKLDVSYNSSRNEWCAVRCETNRFELGWGNAPLEAVAHLLERIGEAAPTQVEVANV
jgi:hypothetical protein